MIIGIIRKMSVYTLLVDKQVVHTRPQSTKEVSEPPDVPTSHSQHITHHQHTIVDNFKNKKGSEHQIPFVSRKKLPGINLDLFLDLIDRGPKFWIDLNLFLYRLACVNHRTMVPPAEIQSDRFQRTIGQIFC